MDILKFNKNELTNLKYSLSREFISTNRAGGYMSTTITCCNTRKYHGLMVCPIEKDPTQNYVLLSSLDETVIQRGCSFNLAIHNFPGVFEPKGHKYIVSFEYTPTPTIVYRVGGVLLKKELLWLHTKQRLLVRYTLLEAASSTKLRVRPFLAFRPIHSLSHENMEASGVSAAITGGVKNKLYEGFPELHMQLNTKSEFYPAPEWYKNFYYSKEEERGYDSTEDLLTTGVFEFDIKKGKSVILSCSLDEEAKPVSFTREFNNELKRRSEKVEFWSCLRHSARQFIVKKGEESYTIAGYPWFEMRGRDALIATCWLTLPQQREDLAMDVFQTMIKTMKHGQMAYSEGEFESADTALWFFCAMQQFQYKVGAKTVWKHFGAAMMRIIKSYSEELSHLGVELHDNGLLWVSKEGKALTWMDMYADGKPVTPRAGYAIEINAMWYNALVYTLSLAEQFGEKEFVAKWKDEPAKIKKSYQDTFWMPELGYYADYVDEYGQNKKIRPNQLIGCGLENRVVDEDGIKAVIDTVNKYLLTNKGIRTLAPNDEDYQGYYMGSDNDRSKQHHQGTTRAWLLPYYFSANIAIYGEGFKAEADKLIKAFEEDFMNYGIGTVSELCAGNPPHKPGGSISHATSVGAILRMREMLEERL